MLLTKHGGLRGAPALPELWYMAEVRVPLSFISEAFSTLAPAPTSSLVCCFCPLAGLRPATLPYSSVFHCPAQGQNFDREVWGVSMVLTRGPASACRGVYSLKFKDQCPMLISTLECGGILVSIAAGVEQMGKLCLILGSVLRAG